MSLKANNFQRLLFLTSKTLNPDCLLVGGIPVYDESAEPVLAKNKLREVVNAAKKEESDSCRLSGLAPPNGIWWYFA